MIGTGIQYYGVMGQRYRGFCEACAQYGLYLDENHVFDEKTAYPSGVEVGKKIAASPIPFTAVAVMSDITAFGVMEGLRLGGKRVPEDGSVIGFDNLLECQYTYPKLTTISQNIELKAEKVGDLLLRMIQGEEIEAGMERNDVEVVERDSVLDINR